ncbi:MAG: hypothetical protein II194_07020 [Bacteroidales bacterium]|nr:hypothetical protein [Bacteroidales bacterium]
MRSKFEDPISGILLALGGCFGGIGLFISPDTTPGTISLVIQAVFIGLFIFRFIRMWMNKEYNPPTHWLPYLKLVEAVLWFFVIIVWWDEVNNRDEIFGIGIMIFIVIYGTKDVYDAVKLLLMNKNR